MAMQIRRLYKRSGTKLFKMYTASMYYTSTPSVVTIRQKHVHFGQDEVLDVITVVT